MKDTLDCLTGEVIERIGEIVLDGSEEWGLNEQLSTTNGYYAFYYCPPDAKLNPSFMDVISDKFSPTKNNDMIDEMNSEYITFHGWTYGINITIKGDKLVEQNVDGFKQWLSQNPTKVIYQLDTPIIEDISPITLQCWKNGTISIDEAIPVETTHTVALNKSAQIQKNIEELSILRNRVETLEKQYNNSTLNQAYELELLRLDMELDNIV